MILDWVPRFLRLLSNAPSEAQTADTSHGFFSNATDFAINGGNFVIDRSQTFHTQTINNTINMGTPVLDRLFPHICPDAGTDALVRSPPPRCLPGTREKILEILNNWLDDCSWMIFWLTGPAGAGKSAVVQTFAEKCAEQGRLGAAYFFIRSSLSHNPRTLIPSLAYQLAVNVPDFQNVLGHAIFQDPLIFHNSLRVQLQRLIIEPFTLLLQRKPEIVQNPLFIVIDGLDECQSIKTQCEIVEMIGEVVRLKKNPPLRWLIASRPELHLQYTFSQPDFAIEYHKEVLLIDADTIKDVNLYLRYDFKKIRTKFSIKAPWPSDMEMRKLEDIASGLFILAATIVCYVSDVEYSDPVRRLTDFFAFMSDPNRATTTKPLQTLDQLYSQILSEIPEDVYLVTKRILALHILGAFILTVPACCLLLYMDQDVFYNAVKKLHSLFDIPPRETDGHMHPHHASFGDYLKSQPRSGEFYISDYCVTKCVSKEFWFWYKNTFADPPWVTDDSFVAMVESARNTLSSGGFSDMSGGPPGGAWPRYGRGGPPPAPLQSQRIFKDTGDEITKWAAGQHYGPVLTPFQLKIVEARLEINPLLLPLPEEEHVHLKWNMLMPSSLVHRSDDVHQISWTKGRSEPATFPRITQLRIISGLFPWLIEVRAEDEESGVTCGEVIDMIAKAMNTLSRASEYNCQPGWKKVLLHRAYRHNRSSSAGVPGRGLGEGLKRMDFLSDLTAFGGLEADESIVQRLWSVTLPGYVVLRVQELHDAELELALPASERLEAQKAEERSRAPSARGSISSSRRSNAISPSVFGSYSANDIGDIGIDVEDASDGESSSGPR